MNNYEIDIDEKDDIIKIIYSNKKIYKMNYSTNCYRYKKPPHNLYKKQDISNEIPSTIITANPLLLEKWKYGNFIQEKNYQYERLTQYEYDKYCYDNNIKNGNAEVYSIFLKLK